MAPTTMKHAKDARQTLNPESISHAYSGRDGKCCCGCSGKHYHRSAMGDYRGGGTPNDARNITRIVRTINANIDITEYGDNYVAVSLGKRLYIAYTR